MCSVLRISVCAAFLAVTLAIGPNSVNINLETRIRIGSRENIHTVLGNLTRFLDKLKHALLPTDKVYIKRRAQETKSKKYFTNFLNDVVQTILNFKYEETIWFFTSLYEEIKYYFKYKGSAFADIVKNPVLKKYLEKTLKKWSETDPHKIKRNIKNYVAIARNKNNALNRIGDFINNFYDEKDEKKMQEIVNKLKNCSKEKDFAKVVTYALHNLVIRHYDNLNYTIRTKISHEINRLSEYAIKRRSKGDMYDLKSISKIIDKPNNVSSLGNNTQTTKEVISIVKPINKDIDDDIIAIPEKGYVADDIEIIKNKYNIISNGNYNNSENKIIFRQHTENKITRSTTQETINTSKVLKRFELKPRPKQNINGTDMNTPVPRDINDGDITTPVPQNISNGTIEYTSQVKNGTSFESGTANKVSVSQNMNTNHVPQNKDTTQNAIISPILRFNKENVKTKSAADKLKHDPPNIANGSLPTIPVPRQIKSSTIPELRVFGNKKRNHPKTQASKENDKTTKSAADINKHVPQNITTQNAITLPVLRVNTANDKTTKPQNITIDSLPTIPVPKHIESTTTPELRVFSNKTRKHPKKARRQRKLFKKRLAQKTSTTIYIPPLIKIELARLERESMRDIEDKVDAAGIDGK